MCYCINHLRQQHTKGAGQRMQWQFSNEMPIYSQLVEQIKIGIVSGMFPPGERLPSVRDLATEAGVNPNTMRGHDGAGAGRPGIQPEDRGTVCNGGSCVIEAAETGPGPAAYSCLFGGDAASGLRTRGDYFPAGAGTSGGGNEPWRFWSVRIFANSMAGCRRWTM